MPLVTVCLPVNDGETSVRSTIESVLSQSLADFELLVVDDGSTDRTADIVAELAAQDNRISFWRNIEKLGAAATFNECLIRASGRYIKPLLPGERLDPEMLAATAAVLEQYSDVALVSVGQRFVDVAGQPIDAPRDLVLPTRYFPGNCTIPGLAACRSMLYPTVNIVGAPGAVIFRADVIGSGFDADFAALAYIDYWSRILIEGHYFFVDKVLCTVAVFDEHTEAERFTFVGKAMEHLRLADKWAPALEEFEISRHDFLDAALMPIAQKVGDFHKHGMSKRALAREQRRTAAFISAAYNNSEVDVLEVVTNELMASQELCLEALRILGFSKYAPDQHVTDEKRIYLLEQQLRELLLSPSWTKTKPLRELKRHVVGQEELDADLANLKQSELAGTSEFNRAYIKYLRRQIGRIKSSLSWRITGPMRALERQAAGRTATAPAFRGD